MYIILQKINDAVAETGNTARSYLQNYYTYPKRDHTLRGRIENTKIPKEDKMSIKVKNYSQIKRLIIRKTIFTSEILRSDVEIRGFIKDFMNNIANIEDLIRNPI